jgi:hypothetical protein
MNSLFGDWKWKNPFATIQRPNPQDFITPGAVITPGVSVNPHRGLGYKATENGITPKNIYYQDADGGIPFPLLEPRNNEWGKMTEKSTGVNVEDLYEDMPGEDGVRQFKSDAPTYQQRGQSTFDADAYTGAMSEYDYDSQIQAEKQKQLELLMQLGMGSPPPEASPLPPQSFGRSSNVQFSLLNPTSTVEQDAILSAPFLQKRRTMYGG